MLRRKVIGNSAYIAGKEVLVPGLPEIKVALLFEIDNQQWKSK
jgi:hypothetical protein